MKAMALLPTKDELTEIRRSMKDAGARPEAEAAAVKAFADGAFTVDTIDSWWAVQRVDQPSLWPHPTSEHAALMSEAFKGRGRGRVDARGRLVKAIGEAEAERAAKLFGLTGLHDYKTVGTIRPDAEPEGDNSKFDDRPKRDRSNPWTWPDGPEAQAERLRIIRNAPTKFSAGLARAAGKRLDGRPLAAK
jgi:hypothetical protein